MNINLTMTLDEINEMLTQLGTLPYAKVANMIAKIVNQAQSQLPAQADAPAQSTPEA